MKKVILFSAYLLLNILVSAGVTLLVMWWWDQTHTDACVTGTIESQTIQPTGTAEASGIGLSTVEEVVVTLPPLDEVVIEITNVFGAGDIETEVVELKRVGEGELWLTNWSLMDEDGNTYTFPAVSIRKGVLDVYTRPGSSDLKKGLNWGLREAVWRSGETVTLLDPDGNVRSSFQVP